MMTTGLALAAIALLVALGQFIAALLGHGRLSKSEIEMLRERDARRGADTMGGNALPGYAGIGGEFAAIVSARKPRWDAMFAP